MTTCDGDRVTACPPVTVVVVAYGDPAPLGAALRSCESPSLIVVDNGLDVAAEKVASAAGARYVAPARNIGFASAVNLGVAHCPPGHDVLLLNPDAVLQPGTTAALVRALGDDPSLAAVAPRLERPDGSVERSRWPVPGPGTVWRDAVGRPPRATQHHFLTGAVLLLRRAALDDVGPFDERFFLYAEESDWQLRALRRGWRLGVVEQAAATHVGGGTSSDPSIRDGHFHRSAEAFGRKWYGAGGWAVMRAGSVLAAARRTLTAHDPASRAAARRALRHHLGRTP